MLFSVLERGLLLKAGEGSISLGRLPKTLERDVSVGLASEINDSRAAVM